MAKKVVKRNQADSTLRNVRAANKNFAHLAKTCAHLALAVSRLDTRVMTLEALAMSAGTIVGKSSQREFAPKARKRR